MDTSIGERGHSQVQSSDSPESEEDRLSTSRGRFEEIIPPSDLASEALRDVYGELTKMLHSSSLLEDLYSARLLTDVEYETIKSQGSNHDQNVDVLAAMRRRGKEDVLQFCQLLFYYKQHNCGNILFTALRKRGVDVSSINTPSPNPPVIKNSSPRYYPELAALNTSFITLVREVKSVGKTVEDLKSICIELLRDVSLNKHEEIKELRACSDGDYILFLQLYWDALNCDLMFSLIQQMNNPKLTRDWEKYRTQVGEACRATLTECRKNLPQGRVLPANRISVGFQTDQPPFDVMVQKILDLKDFLKKMMGMKEADFEGFANSDVTLFYTVGRNRLPFLVRLCALHRRTLREFSITIVFVPGEFIYDVNTDQDFPYCEITSHSEQLHVRDLKTEMVRQFEELKKSRKKAEEERIEMLQKFEELKKSRVSSEDLQDEIISLRTEMLQKFEELKKSKVSSEDLQHEITSLTLKLQAEEMAKKMTEEGERRRAKEFVELQNEKKKLAQKNEQLNEKLISVQESFMTKKESVMSSISSEEMKSEIQSLLEQEPSSVAGLQDKLKLLLEEWSKEDDSCKQKTPFPNQIFFEMHFETVQKTIIERFDALVKKLGCAEKKTLMKELRNVFFSEVRPLRESFQQVYSKVFTPQIEEVDKQAVERFRELFDENPDRMFQNEEMDLSNQKSLKMVNLPNSLHDASSVIIGRNVHVVGGGTPDARSFENVQVYNIDTGKWSTLGPAPQYWGEAISIGNNLVLIGGRESSNQMASNMVSTWLVDEGRWSQIIPPMNTKRIRPGVLKLKIFVFVFGGRGEEGEDILDSYEVLDIEKNQWIDGRGLLPQPLWYLKLGVFGDMVVLTSARTSRYTTTTKAWMIPVRVLEDSVTNSSSQPFQWTPIADSPYHSSSLLTNSKHPVLAGGFRGDKATKDIYRYTSDNWELVGQLSEPRIRSSLITISSNSFLVVGGHSDPNDHLSSMLYSIELIMYS